MFDPAAFDDPETFKPSRSYGKSFQFGFGHHECIGKMIGMVMIPEMVKQVLLKQNIKENYPAKHKGGPFPEEHFFSWDP